MNPLDILWQAAVILALVFANGFFVAAEFAVVKVRFSQLRPLLKSGDWRVKMALKATRHLDACLSATQLGITISSIALGAIGKPYVVAWLRPILMLVGITDPVTIDSTGFGIGFALITFLHVVLGELAPKSLAIQRPKAISLWVSGPLMIFYYVFYPAIWILNGTANLFLRWAGLEPPSESEHAFSPEELDFVLSHSHHTHPTDAVINKIMIRSLRLRETTAAQVMVPREEVDALYLDLPIEENIRVAMTTGHSRYPVCRRQGDPEVVGFLLVKEWLWQIEQLYPDKSFGSIIRKPLTFTPKTPLPAMLQFFRVSRSHLAIVLDDVSGDPLAPDACRMAGIVTLEDVLEEIVGEIRDELDIERGPIFEHTEDSILIDALLPMREVRAETGWNIGLQPKETATQWVQRRCGQIPRRGERLHTGEFEVTTPDTHARLPRRLRIRRMSMEEIKQLEEGRGNERDHRSDSGIGL
ncbi:MAG TPA: hemolysin family protein [Verrucomicrobiae bacterium]|nr:hemolysin family protein [Verrucomicrobiae bacterium]